MGQVFFHLLNRKYMNINHGNDLMDLHHKDDEVMLLAISIKKDIWATSLVILWAVKCVQLAAQLLVEGE